MSLNPQRRISLKVMMAPNESCMALLVCFVCVAHFRCRESNTHSTDGKIVGVRYYNGMATAGEVVICKREPSNQVRSTCLGAGLRSLG